MSGEESFLKARWECHDVTFMVRTITPVDRGLVSMVVDFEREDGQSLAVERENFLVPYEWLSVGEDDELTCRLALSGAPTVVTNSDKNGSLTMIEAVQRQLPSGEEYWEMVACATCVVPKRDSHLLGALDDASDGTSAPISLLAELSLSS